jgi:hypothetical protein
MRIQKDYPAMPAAAPPRHAMNWSATATLDTPKLERLRKRFPALYR